MTPSKPGVRKAVEAAIHWAWDSMVEVKGWTGSYLMPHVYLIDTLELLYGLAVARNSGFKLNEAAFTRSLRYVKSQLAHFDKGFYNAKTFVWSVNLYSELKEPVESKHFQQVLKGLKMYEVTSQGWSNWKGGPTSIFNTALLTVALKSIEQYKTFLEAVVEWLSQIQNYDGGWGWYRGYLSDPTCTAATVIALKEMKFRDSRLYRKAEGWLLHNYREKDNMVYWPTATEPGQEVSTGTSSYTHFSTPYCIVALLKLASSNDVVSKAVRYLLDLQHASGGWPFAKGLDWFKSEMLPLPWSTANAIWSLCHFLRV